MRLLPILLSLVVRADGQPGDIRVLSTPDSAFEAPTVQAVSLLRFTPARLGGRPVPVRVEQPITWRAEAATVSAADFVGQGVRGGVPAAASEAAAGDSVNGYELSQVDEWVLTRPGNSPAAGDCAS